MFSGCDLNGNNRDDVVVGPGPDPVMGTPVRAYRYEDGLVRLLFTIDEVFDASFSHGTNVAAGQF